MVRALLWPPPLTFLCDVQSLHGFLNGNRSLVRVTHPLSGPIAAFLFLVPSPTGSFFRLHVRPPRGTGSFLFSGLLFLLLPLVTSILSPALGGRSRCIGVRRLLAVKTTSRYLGLFKKKKKISLLHFNGLLLGERRRTCAVESAGVSVCTVCC